VSKSLLANFIATLVCIIGYLSPVHSDILLMTGLFALSGGATNWLAIHMLFENVPYIYGSGVVPNRFEEFKAAIKSIIIEQFFTPENIEKIFKENKNQVEKNISNLINFDKVFTGLTDAIVNSQLGTMLSMIGGKKALEPLREPIILKLKDLISDLESEETNYWKNNDLSNNLTRGIEEVIDNRLQELTPEKVKKIVENMIKEHLGWLVVWGCIFGGFIGLVIGTIE